MFALCFYTSYQKIPQIFERVPFLLSVYVRDILAELCPIATPPFAHSSSIDFPMQRRSPTGPRSRWQPESKRSMRFCPDTACLADDSRSGCLRVVQPPF